MQETDANLLQAAKLEKGHSAFEEILLRYEKLIYYIARRYFNDSEDALDASQDAAIKIYNGLSSVSIPPEGSLKAWICTVTARTCLDTLRKRRVKIVELTEEVITQTHVSAEEEAKSNERTKEILTAIQALPENHRMVVILRDLEGLSYEEISNVLKINVGTVKSRLSRARLELKRSLE